MADHDTLIDSLSQSARPVRRPLPTPVRVALWTLLALPCGVLVTLHLHHGWTDWSRPGALWPMIALGLSFVLGALGIATGFDLGIAGRKVIGWTVFVPLIAAWLAASAMTLSLSADPIGLIGSGSYCYTFMTLAGAPMVVLAILMLRRTRALQPGKALAVAGLGIAFMAATLLTLCHSVDGQVIDYVMHLAAGLTLVGATVLLGRRWVAIPK